MKSKMTLTLCALAFIFTSNITHAQNINTQSIGTKYHFQCRPTNSSETVSGEFTFTSRDSYITVGDGKWVDGTVIEVASLNVSAINYNQTTPTTLTGLAKCWDYNSTRPGGFYCETEGSGNPPYSLKIYWDETSNAEVAFHLNNKTYQGSCTPTRL